MPDPQNIIRLGRAYVRLIETAQVVAGYTEHRGEIQRLQRLVTHYQLSLRLLLATVSPHVAAEILMASDKVLGTVQNHGLN